MNLTLFHLEPQSSNGDDRPVVILATQRGNAEAELVRGLGLEGFEVRRCRTQAEVLDVFTDALLGRAARPSLLLIGSGMYRQLDLRIASLLRRLRWDVQLMVQLDDHEAGFARTAGGRTRPTRVGFDVEPSTVAHMASRQVADAQLEAQCGRDRRNWGDATRRGGEGP
jgi:hypothetical protein